MARLSQQLAAVGTRMYAAVARLLPARMRESVGRDLVQAFEDQCRAAVLEGRTRLLARVCARGLLDLMWTVAAERWLLAWAYLESIRTGGGGGMGTVLQDVRFAIRGLLRAPGFTAVVLGTLIVAIGANTAIFTVVDGVLLRPLPYPDADRLVTVSIGRIPSPGRSAETTFSDRGYWHFVNNSRAFDGFGGYESPSQWPLTGEGPPLQVDVGEMTASAFEILGTSPLLGRFPTAEEDLPGGPRVALMSHGLWVSRYGADPSILGRVIELNGIGREVIGVMPEGYSFPSPGVHLFVPLRLDPASENFGSHHISTIARLAPGFTIQAAVEDAERLIARFDEAGYGPTWFNGVFSGTAVVRTAKERIVGSARRPLLILLGTMGFVLLIACSNVANLFLVRAETRTRESAIRAALGSGRLRLIRSALTESLVLAVVGGAGGVAVAYLATRGLVALTPESVPRLEEIRIRGSVLLFTAGVSILAGLLLGVLSALRSAPGKLMSSIRDGGRGATVGRDRHRVRNALVVGQVALALVLLVGSGLMVRSFQALRAVDPGINAEGLLTFRLFPPPTQYPGGEELARFYDELLGRLESIPGVASAGGITTLPLTGRGGGAQTLIEEFPVAEGEALPSYLVRRVTPGYFETMGIPVVEGRSFTADDDNARLGSIIVSASIKDVYWPEASALDKRIIVGTPARSVGVVGDVHAVGLDIPAEPHVYKPMLDSVGGGARAMTMVVRSDGDPLSLVPAIRSAVQSIDSDLPVSDVRLMEEIVARSMSRTSFTMSLLMLAAVIALFLGSVGIYGVISYVVSQRSSEIGLRLALGAASENVSRMVLMQGMKLAAAGVVIGLLIAVMMGRLLTSLLYDVAPYDLLTLVGGSLIFLTVAAVASIVPAVRAARIPPGVALGGV